MTAKTSAARTPPWRATILLAAVWCAAVGSRFAVGLVNDDADYLLAARSLAAGPFFQKLFNNHLLRDRLPGFPLLLAPFAAWARPPFEALKLVPFSLTILGGVLLWELLKPWLTPWARWAVLALYLFNPLTVEFSGRVMTEPLFTVQALAAFLLLRRVLEADEAPSAWALGLLLGWAALTRGEGVSLSAGVGLGLWVGRRRARLLPVLGTAAAVAGLVFVGNFLSHRTPTAYLQIWAASAARVSWTAHGVRLLRVLAWTAFGGAPRLPASAAELAGATALAGALAVAAGRGLSRLEREPGRGRGEAWAMTGFLAAYLLIHALWPVADPRFFIVLLPFLLLASAAGLTDRRAPRWLGPAAFAALLLSYGAGAGRALAETARRPQEDRAPLETFAWMREHLPADARVWGFYDSSLVELDTGRAGVFLPVPSTPEALRALLLNERIGFVYDAPLRFALEPVQGLEDAAERWRLSTVWVRDPRAYEPVYRNEVERTAVYRVLPSDTFPRADAAYHAALDALGRSDWDGAFAGLETALLLEPDLAPALNAYGATALLTGRHLELGRRRLERAVRLRPEDPLARANLERLKGRRDAR